MAREMQKWADRISLSTQTFKVRALTKISFYRHEHVVVFFDGPAAAQESDEEDDGAGDDEDDWGRQDPIFQEVAVAADVVQHHSSGHDDAHPR